jgi:hypothetical protein
MVKVDVAMPLAGGVTGVVTVQAGAPGWYGDTEQDRATAALKPFTDVIVIVEVAEPPGLTLEGERAAALIVKFGEGVATMPATFRTRQFKRSAK